MMFFDVTGRKGTRTVDNGKVTITDIAAAARVSKATVDRVLNGRENVKERTRARVMAAALDLGYVTEREAVPPVTEVVATIPLGQVRPVRLDFILPGGSNSFIALLENELRLAGAGEAGVEVRISSTRSFDPEALAEALAGLAGASDGVGIVGVDHPAVREAIRTLVKAGLPVMTLASDISNVATIGYVGVDNRSAGRLAGLLLGRLAARRAGPVALFAGALSYRGHEEREMGFRHILKERFPGLDIAVHREVHDDPERAHDEMRAVLADYPDLVGLYNVGAGNRGIGQALLESGRAGEVAFIGHDLSEHTRRLLLSGVMDAAIDQNPQAQARLAVSHLTAAARGATLPSPPPLAILPVFSENIPIDLGG